MSQDNIKIDFKIFNGCTKLTKIKIPKYVKKISINTFANCTSLSEVLFEEESSLFFISSYAFKNCKSLKTIKIPPKVIMIGKHAFENCTSLQIMMSSNTKIVDELSYDSLDIRRIQTYSLEDEYEIALRKIVSILKLPEIDIQNCIDNDEVLDHIVDAFKKFPNLYNEDQNVIMAKLSELGLENEIRNYFSDFYYSFLTLFIKLPTGYTSKYTYKEDDKVEILYKEMYDRFFDGINQIHMFYVDHILPNNGTFKDNKVENFSTITYMQTMLGG